MSRKVVNAEIEVYKSGNTTDTPDFVIQNDVEDASIETRAKDLMDVGNFTINNTYEQYGINSNHITLGDKLKFRVRMKGENSMSVRWTAFADTPTYETDGPNRKTIDLSGNDWVFRVLENRTLFASYQSRPISEDTTGIMQEVLNARAPNIDRSRIQPIDKQTDLNANGNVLLDTIHELTQIGDAVMASDDESLVITQLERLLDDQDGLKQFDLKPSDHAGKFDVQKDPDGITNSIRVQGGRAFSLENSQTNQSSTTTVTDSTRLTQQISTRKSEIDRVEIYTSGDNNGDPLQVRIQADDGGAPTAPGDRNSDIARKRLDPEFLANGGYTTFILPRHSLHVSNPWIIVDSDGSTGQPVGVDSNGNLTYKQYYPYPVVVEQQNGSSINEYGRHEDIHQDESIRTNQAARDVAQRILTRDAKPNTTIQFTAESLRAHNLSTLDVIGVDYPESGAVGDFIVTKRKDTYNGTNMVTTITAQDAETI